MGKYDEFGRPIYETAEEYNRAHRKGNNSRTYSNPEGDAYKHNPAKNVYRNQNSMGRNAAGTGVKKTNSVIVKLAIIVICSIVGVVIGFITVGISVGDIYEVIPENVADIIVDDGNEDGGLEYIGDDTTPLPEGFETFSYNGQLYTLPASYEEIAQMGFVLETDYDENYILPTDYEESLILNDENDLMAAMIHVNNHTGEEIPLGKSEVSYFYMENPAAFDEGGMVPDFVFCDGLTFDSNYAELENYLGIPYYYYEDYSEDGYHYKSYQWSYYGEEEIHTVCVTFWNGVISSVEVEKKVVDEY